MTDIQWEDPPSPAQTTTSSRRWDAVVAQLVKRPGEWALVQTDVARSNGYGRALKISRGEMRAFRDGKFEGRFVATTPGRGDLYVRAIP